MAQTMGAQSKKIIHKAPWRFMSAILVTALLSGVVPCKSARAQIVVPCDPCTSAAIIAETDTLGPMLAGIAVSMNNAALALDTIVGVQMPLIINALYGDPLTPGPGIDADMNSQFTTLFKKYLDPLTTELLPMMSQANADKTVFYNDVESQAKLSSNATVSEKYTACAMSKAYQLDDALKAFVETFADAVTQLVVARGTGPGAGQASEAQEACEQAPFISNVPFGGGAYSSRWPEAIDNKLAQCPQSDAYGAKVPLPDTLIDGDLRMQSVFRPLQYSLPDQMQLTPNNHVHFTPQTANEWDFVAAWRYCESQLPRMQMVVNGSSATTTVTNVQSMLAISQQVSAASPAIKDCMSALAYRTACPYNSSTDFASVDVSSGTCWQIQDLACHRLINPPPSGLGITATGNPDVDYALANCDADGLSEAMFDYALASRCADNNYTTVAVPSDRANTAKSYDEINACQRAKAAFQQKLIDQQTTFMQDLNAMQHGCGNECSQ